MAIIREATAADIPALLDLYRQLALDPSIFDEEAGAPAFGERTFEELSSVPGHHLLVAEENGAVVGTLVLVILPGLARAIRRWAVVEYVVVDENCRSKGIGEQMMEHAAAMAQAEGCYKIMLCSDKRRPDAHRFYRRIGYEQTHEAFHRHFRQS